MCVDDHECHNHAHGSLLTPVASKRTARSTHDNRSSEFFSPCSGDSSPSAVDEIKNQDKTKKLIADALTLTKGHSGQSL